MGKINEFIELGVGDGLLLECFILFLWLFQGSLFEQLNQNTRSKIKVGKTYVGEIFHYELI